VRKTRKTRKTRKRKERRERKKRKKMRPRVVAPADVEGETEIERLNVDLLQVKLSDL
jgi:hypothetical protein